MLCGSVARGDDTNASDIDFYVSHFNEADRGNDEARARADRLVEEYRRILQPYCVDIRPLPGWPLGVEHEVAMRNDAIPLDDL